MRWADVRYLLLKAGYLTLYFFVTILDAQSGQTGSTVSPFADIKAQKAFEKGLLEKTAKQTSDIILYDNRIVLYKCESDVMIYVIGGINENEVMLYNVIVALRDSLHLLFKWVNLQSLYHLIISWRANPFSQFFIRVIW